MADLLNELEAVVVAAAADDLLFAVLERLYDHTRAHFELEEQAMAQMTYAGAVEHRREHLMLMAELKTFIARLRKGNEQLDNAALQELKTWLVGHVLGTDRSFAAAAVEAGLNL
jgi:hemerythrin-like metal-binding protein